MGGLFSIFRRKKQTLSLPNFSEILEKLDKEITDEQAIRDRYVARHKSVVSKLLLSFIIIELLLILIYYFIPIPTEYHLYHLLVIIVIPFLGYLSKKIITFMYNRRIARQDEKLKQLMKDKTDRVEELKRITNFEQTKKLLERYDTPAPKRGIVKPASTPQRPPAQPRPPSNPNPMQTPFKTPAKPQAKTPSAPAPTPKAPVPAPQTPQAPVNPNPMVTPIPSNPQTGPRDPPSTMRKRQTYVVPVPKLHNPTPVPTFQPEAPPKKGWFDSMVDYVIGDGPGYSVPVKCLECGSVNLHLPQNEVASARFTCYSCRATNNYAEGSTGNRHVEVEEKEEETKEEEPKEESSVGEDNNENTEEDVGSSETHNETETEEEAQT